MSILRIFALVMLAASTSLAGVAQVFIPDQLERDWLNSELPGIVDAAGIMDTLHPGIVLLDTVGISLETSPIAVDTVSVEMVSLGYLDSLSFISLVTDGTLYTTLVCTGLPAELDRLDIDLGYGGELFLPRLPNDMQILTVSMLPAAGSEHGITMHVSQLPDSTDHVTLDWVVNMDWEGTWVIRDMGLRGPVFTEHLSIPSISTNSLYVWPSSSGCEIGTLDLTSVEADRISLSGMYNSYVIWPSSCPSIGIDQCSSLDLSAPLPSDLLYLDITGNITCMPTLPAGLISLNATDVAISCIPNWPSALNSAYINGTDFTENTAIYCSVLNSTCPGANPGISGRVFVDTDADGVYDDGEPALPQSQITLQPNGQVTGCSSDGTWEIGVQPGEYTITAGSGYPYIQSITPATHSASVPEMGDIDLGNDFAVTLIPDIQDLRVSIYAMPARPGFDNALYLRCENYGTTQVDAELTLAFDADQTWVSSSVAPTLQSGNNASWSFPAMPIGTVQNIVVDLSTATSVALGTDIAHTLTADPIATDETPGDNTYTHQDSVVGSFDPNDKLLDPKVLSPAQVAQGATPIEYTIRFQNTGTFLAERVVILDTLSEDLQWESMRFIASSHVNHWYITDGVLHVIHNDIMLPDSTSDEAGSHGFVKFSMLPKTDLQDGATITNIAHIVFDFNEPIITPPAVFSVDVEAGITDRSDGSEFLLIPNPAHDRIQLRSDRTGVLRYRIMDVLGAQVQIGTTPANGWVNVETLPPGPYVIEVEQAEVRTSQRFMKQ